MYVARPGLRMVRGHARRLRRRVVTAGMRFGRLTVLRDHQMNDATVLVGCDCGTIKEVRAGSLGRSCFSCGCLRRARCIERSKCHGKAHLPEYKVWAAIK